MSIDKSCLEASVEASINALDSDSTPEVILTTAYNAGNLCTDNASFLSLGCDLPDIASGDVPPGTMYFVDDIGVPVYATSTDWLGVDGRLYRKDITVYNLYTATSSYTGNTIEDPPGLWREACYFTNWSTTSMAGTHRAGITQSGELYSWGNNNGNGFFCRGSIGDGTTTNRTVPTREFFSDTTWSCVVAGSWMSSALKTDGTLWSWGLGLCGALGTGQQYPSLNILTPCQEGTRSTNWTKVSNNGGQYRTAAIKSDGTLWFTGKNNAGAFGNNSTANSTGFVQGFSNESNFCDVSLPYTSHAIKTDGTLWSAGENQLGKLASNDVVDRSSPVQEISSSTDWCKLSDMSGGWFCSPVVALKNDGSIWAWGPNPPSGTPDVYSSPVQEITSSTNWCLASDAYALKNDGSLWCFNNAVPTYTATLTSYTDWCQMASSRNNGVIGIRVE